MKTGRYIQNIPKTDSKQKIKNILALYESMASTEPLPIYKQNKQKQVGFQGELFQKKQI